MDIQTKIDNLRAEKNITKKFNIVDDILPFIKKEVPNIWFRNSRLFKFVSSKKNSFVNYFDFKLFYGRLYITKNGSLTKESRFRNTIYLYNSIDISPWFYYSTGISNFGENFSGFFFVLEEKGLISDFPFVPVFPKKAIVSILYNEFEVGWKSKILENCKFDNEIIIKKLFRRFINLNDLCFSIFLGRISSVFGLENGWENQKILNQKDYLELIRYLIEMECFKNIFVDDLISNLFLF